MDTLRKPSLWLWDGRLVFEGGFVAAEKNGKEVGQWFDALNHRVKGVTHWREIMQDDVSPPHPPTEEFDVPVPKKRLEI